MTIYVLLILSKFQILVASRVRIANAHHHTKFHQNQSNDCRVIAFNGIQNVIKFEFLKSWNALKI